MRRLIMALMLAMFVAAITAGAAMAAPKIVDPDTLQPPPPPGAECRQTAQHIICQTFFDEEPSVNEPGVMLSCGTGERQVYLSETVHREGIRWYSSEGLLLRRFGREHSEGTLSLSPTGAEPTVRVFDHNSWWDYYTVPGDEDSAVTTIHGNGFRMLLPGAGGLVHIAGYELPDGPLHGVARDLNVDENGFVSDKDVNDALCAALGDPIAE